jgi:hypothetical protein
MGMGKAEGIHSGQIQRVEAFLQHNIRAQIDHQMPVYQKSGSGPDITAPRFTGPKTGLAHAKQGRYTFGSRGSQKQNFHSIILLSPIP